MTVLKQILIFGFLAAAPRIDERQISRLPRQLQRLLAVRLASGIGQVEIGSIEEQIWRELGALPLSRRKHCLKRNYRNR